MKPTSELRSSQLVNSKRVDSYLLLALMIAGNLSYGLSSRRSGRNRASKNPTMNQDKLLFVDVSSVFLFTKLKRPCEAIERAQLKKKRGNGLTEKAPSVYSYLFPYYLFLDLRNGVITV